MFENFFFSINFNKNFNKNFNNIFLCKNFFFKNKFNYLNISFQKKNFDFNMFFRLFSLRTFFLNEHKYIPIGLFKKLKKFSRLPTTSKWVSFYNIDSFTYKRYVSGASKGSYFHCFPLSGTNKAARKRLYSKLVVGIVPSYYQFYYSLFFRFLEFKIKKKIVAKISNRFRLKKVKMVHNIISKLTKSNWKLSKRMGKGFFLNEMVHLFFLAFLFKDALMIANWISRSLSRLNFKIHKKLVVIVKNLVNKNKNIFMLNTKCLGFFFDLRGKVGVVGNARKRHVFISIGKHTYTTKSLKFFYDFRIIRTGTGCMGMHTIIMY